MDVFTLVQYIIFEVIIFITTQTFNTIKIHTVEIERRNISKNIHISKKKLSRLTSDQESLKNACLVKYLSLL